MSLYKRLILILLIGLGTGQLNAQTIPLGTLSIEDYYRRMQLMGKLDSTVSFTIRPLFPANISTTDDVFDPDSGLKNDHWVDFNRSIKIPNEQFSFQLLPVSWKQQTNSHHPYGWNDGAMVPAKGYQTLLSAGVFAKIGFLTIQLAPEYVYAANRDFQVSEKVLRGIDLPERFGNSAFSKATWGQSSVRLNFGPASLGISNENLWWGPGRKSSLMMSNNAPGFKHITLNTTKPIASPIGSFEAQFIGGKLESSRIAPYDDTYVQQDWRYVSGMNISYQPKWLPGLFVGFTRVFQAYNDDIEGFAGYVPFLTPFQKKNTNDGDEFPRDQILSLYTRWVFPKVNAEVYFEFGQNDNSHDFRDFITAPEHSRTYLFGFSKLVPLKVREGEFIEINAELTQTSQNIDRVLRGAGSWYTHGQIKHGYTNRGQIMGAGMDLGANIQSLDVSWVKGLKKIGLSFDRYEHNPHDAPVFLNGNSRKWVDYALAGIGEWNYKNMLLHAKVQGIQSLNYQWRLEGYDPALYYMPNNDVLNFHGELGVAFRF